MLKWTSLLVVFCSTLAVANDTPFLTYRCYHNGNTPFKVEFENNDKGEIHTWHGPLKGTRITFEKIDKTMAEITIKTGLPVLSVAAPQVYTFTAPLVTKRFSFSSSLKPLNVNPTSYELACEKLSD